MSRPVLIGIVLLAAFFCTWASTTPAAESAPASPAAARAPTAPAPARTVMIAPAPSGAAQPAPLVRARRLTAEETALVDVEEQGRRQVAELVAAAKALPDGPARRALERKVEEVKKQSRVEFLRVKVRFARERGDLAAAREAEQRIDFILNPPMPPAVAPAAREKASRGEGTRP